MHRPHSIPYTGVVPCPFHTLEWYHVHSIHWSGTMSIPYTGVVPCPFHTLEWYHVHSIHWSGTMSIPYTRVVPCPFHTLEWYHVRSVHWSGTVSIPWSGGSQCSVSCMCVVYLLLNQKLKKKDVCVSHSNVHSLCGGLPAFPY